MATTTQTVQATFRRLGVGACGKASPLKIVRVTNIPSGGGSGGGNPRPATGQIFPRGVA